MRGKQHLVLFSKFSNINWEGEMLSSNSWCVWGLGSTKIVVLGSSKRKDLVNTPRSPLEHLQSSTLEQRWSEKIKTQPLISLVPDCVNKISPHSFAAFQRQKVSHPRKKKPLFKASIYFYNFLYTNSWNYQKSKWPKLQRKVTWVFKYGLKSVINDVFKKGEEGWGGSGSRDWW